VFKGVCVPSRRLFDEILVQLFPVAEVACSLLRAELHVLRQP